MAPPPSGKTKPESSEATTTSFLQPTHTHTTTRTRTAMATRPKDRSRTRTLVCLSLFVPAIVFFDVFVLSVTSSKLRLGESHAYQNEPVHHHLETRLVGGETWGTNFLRGSGGGTDDNKDNNNDDDTPPPPQVSKRLHKMQEELFEKALRAPKGDHAGANGKTNLEPRSVFAETPPDQKVDFQPPVLPLPSVSSAVGSGSGVVLLVPSHQGSFVKRQAIRETWMAAAKEHGSGATILFVIAQSSCGDFEADFERTTRGTSATGPTCAEAEHNFLRNEQREWGDLLEIPMEESYERLSEKMVQAYHWVLENIPTTRWIAKADDDMFVRVNQLEKYLRRFNHEVPVVLGEIVHRSPVARSGKWAEDPSYKPRVYPNWPKGSAGHVLSKAAVEYVVHHSGSLHRYQGEDTNLGIWLDDALKKGALEDLALVDARKMFGSSGKANCAFGSFLIVGHELTPEDLFECQKKTHYGGKAAFLGVSWTERPSPT